MQVRGRGRGATVPSIIQTAGTSRTVTSPITIVSAFCLAASSCAVLSHAFPRHLTAPARPCRSLSTLTPVQSRTSPLRTTPLPKFPRIPYYPRTSKMATITSNEAPEWGAQKVRDTFLKFFEERGHTFGTSLLATCSCATDSHLPQSNLHLWCRSQTQPCYSQMLA
jgi:hypothetical protein